jgi:hypothetical protein
VPLVVHPPVRQQGLALQLQAGSEQKRRRALVQREFVLGQLKPLL